VSVGALPIADNFRAQAHYCRLLGSPLYGHLMEEMATDLEAGGPALAVMAGHEQEPWAGMWQLRLMNAVHRIVLSGGAPELARHYPSAGGVADPEGAWPALRSLLAEQPEAVRSEMESAPVQTNEVGRCMALAGAFCTVSARTGLPLSVLEVGASAGFNLRFDRYRYEALGIGLGPPDSPLRFADFVSEGRPPLDAGLTVAERAGCDASPLDPSRERDRLLLQSFVWPDQVERFEALRGALDVAAREPLTVERADAAEWAERALAQQRPGTATVLFHSLVLMYLEDATRERMVAAIEAAGARATPEAPFAWLRMELGGDEAEVTLTSWPGGRAEVMARAGYHGRPVRWLAR
jgi:hypothetical protein